jgi:hypothetical protein
MSCDICGHEPAACICPRCPECGEKGSILCYALHGLQMTQEQGQIIVATVADDPALAQLGEQSDEIVEQIRPLLAGKGSGLQGMVLADLLAIFLSSHGSDGDEADTYQLRRALMAVHCDAVWKLVAHYDAQDEETSDDD